HYETVPTLTGGAIADVIDSSFSVQPTTAGTWSVLLNGRVFRVTRGADGTFQVNGRTLEVETFDPRDMRSKSGGALQTGRHEISSPMPGKIVRILVAPGDQVEEGRGLLVVEAMKMQNELKSPKSGRVVEMRAKVNAAVAAGEVV